MKQLSLASMRNYLDAVRRIIEAMPTDQFEHASHIASKDRVLTKQMKRMRDSLNNKSFTKIGSAFQRSGDTQRSLQALNETMAYCVSCHATYRPWIQIISAIKFMYKRNQFILKVQIRSQISSDFSRTIVNR